MVTVTCLKEDCKYNVDGYCEAAVILINDYGVCEED